MKSSTVSILSLNYFHFLNHFQDLSNNYLVENVEKYYFKIKDINLELLKLLGKDFNPISAIYSDLVPFFGTLIDKFIKESIIFMKGIFEYDFTIFKSVDNLLI